MFCCYPPPCESQVHIWLNIALPLRSIDERGVLTHLHGGDFQLLDRLVRRMGTYSENTFARKYLSKYVLIFKISPFQLQTSTVTHVEQKLLI